MLPLLYIVRMDVNMEYVSDFVKWYDTRHGPDLIASGFFSCNAYHSIRGGPLICNVYEIADIDIFSTAAYQSVRKKDEQLVNEVLHKISNHSNTTYCQTLLLDKLSNIEHFSGNSPCWSRAVKCPVISTSCFDFSPEDDQILRDWVNSYYEHISQSESGLIRVRLLKQEGKHPLFPSSQPEWLLMCEWASVQNAEQHYAPNPFLPSFDHDISSLISDCKSNLAALNASLLNAHSWSY